MLVLFAQTFIKLHYTYIFKSMHNPTSLNARSFARFSCLIDANKS
jgi:hypothetical protein